MDLPILAALTAEEIAEALCAQLLRKRGINPDGVRPRAEIAYNTKGPKIVAAVCITALEPIEESPSVKKGKGDKGAVER